jgi:hypothetical protein
MTIMPMGDYYVWYCAWCDSENLTSWVRIEHGSVCCAACQKRFEVSSAENLLNNEGSVHYDNDISLSGMPGVAMSPCITH